MEQYLKNLSDNILSEMGRRNWNQEVAAGFCGMCSRELRAIISQKKDVRLSTLKNIEEGLEIPISKLIGTE